MQNSSLDYILSLKQSRINLVRVSEQEEVREHNLRILMLQFSNAIRTITKIKLARAGKI